MTVNSAILRCLDIPTPSRRPSALATRNGLKRLRARIESHVWPLSNLTISIGLSTLTCATASPWTLVEEADQALYQSKRMGRNRVTHLNSVRGSSEGETKVL